MRLIVVVPTAPGGGCCGNPDGLLGVLGMAITEDLIGTPAMPIAHRRPVDRRDVIGECKIQEGGWVRVGGREERRVVKSSAVAEGNHLGRSSDHVLGFGFIEHVCSSKSVVSAEAQIGRRQT